MLSVQINGSGFVMGGDDITMWEVNETAKVITKSIAKDAKVIFGVAKDDRLRKRRD